MADAPIPYRDDVETELPDEAATIDDTIEIFRQLQSLTFEEHRHARSGTHAKTHGVVTGTLTVASDLPPELAQSMFASPGRYEVVARLASEPGQLDPDTVQRARGLSLKVLGVPGEKFQSDWDSQDFLFNTWPTIPQGDAATFRDLQRARLEHFGEELRTKLTHALRHPTPKQNLFDRTPNIPPVAHTYYSQSAFRYGDHIAKFGVFPASDAQLAQTERTVSSDDAPGVLRDWTTRYFAENSARFDFRVQLCTDLDAMPIEDAAVEWDDTRSPYRTVATVELPVQDSFSAARRVYAEDRLSFRPWYGLTSLRPLGSINRARRRVYEASGQWRRAMNANDESRPRTLADVPH